MRGPETRLRLKIRDAIIKEYPTAYVRKIHGNAFQNIGIADLLCSIKGYFFALEVKVPGRKGATDAQLLEGRKVLNSGAIFGVVTSIEETLTLIKKGLEWHQKKIERRQSITQRTTEEMSCMRRGSASTPGGLKRTHSSGTR